MDNENIETKKEEKAPKVWRRKYIHLATPENDIKYRGPLSYRHFRIIGWVLLALSQIGAILTFGERIYSAPGMYGVWPGLLSSLFSLMGPLFLIAVFSIVLNAKDGYRRLIINYTGLSILVFLVTLFVYEHYIVGFFALSNGSQAAHAMGEGVFSLIGGEKGFISYNLFVDLLLCTLVTFFINYHPKKYFQGKKLIIFRLFALLPIFYEITCATLKICSVLEFITIPALVNPLLTTKSPVSFLVFVVLALFFKLRERLFIKRGKTHADFQLFQKTNVNSLHFSIFLSVTIVIASIIDAILMVILTAAAFASSPLPEGITEEVKFASSLNQIYSCGFGQTFHMLLIIPLIMLFDYRKVYKDKTMDLIIPVAGIGLTAFVFIEGGYDVVRVYLSNMINNAAVPPEEGGGELAHLIYTVKSMISRK